MFYFHFHFLLWCSIPMAYYSYNTSKLHPEISRVVFHKSVHKVLLFNIKPTTMKTIDKAVVT